MKRKEDERFLRGQATFITDVKVTGVLHAVFVRSPYAHAKIMHIDSEAARKESGVIGIFAAQDLIGLLGEVPCGVSYAFARYPKHMPIAESEVNHVGEIVAVVLATDEYKARDAADLVVTEYEQMETVVDVEQALNSPQIALVHNQYPDNLAYSQTKEFGDTEKAFGDAARIFGFRISNQRVFSAAIEPRRVVSSYNPSSNELTVWSATQYPHLLRTFLSRAIRHPEDKLRVIAPDLGGGFGGKSDMYAEELLIPVLAKLIGGQVCWLETRSESLLATAHARDVIVYLQVACKDSGRILALKSKVIADIGAYYHFLTPGFPIAIGLSLPSYYDIPAFQVEVNAVFTNKKATDAYRGVIAAEVCFCIERMMDLIAGELHLDPTEVRARNYIQRKQYPFKTITGEINPNGDHPRSLEILLEHIKYPELLKEHTVLREKYGIRRGIGMSSYWEPSGFAPPAVTEGFGLVHGAFESACVRVLPSGKVNVITGSSSHGQGHETVFAQIVADSLGLDPNDVSIFHGDTVNSPYGIGTWASRSAAVGGGAISVACDRVLKKAKEIAAWMLGTSASDLKYESSAFFGPADPSNRIHFQKIVDEAYLGMHLPIGMEPGLEATCYFNPSEATFASGTHCAEVEVDIQTGKIKVLRYIAVNDFGNVINPMIVEGQVHGGVMQGIGQALLEQVYYDEDGRLVNSNFLDYLIPTATDPMSGSVENFETLYYYTKTAANPLGVKGMGESGAIVAPAAIVNAVSNALQEFHVDNLEMPLSPQRVLAAIRGKQSK